jgi:methyl-accepting chemotaxis protein
VTRRRRLLDLLRPRHAVSAEEKVPEDANVVAAQARAHEAVKEAVQSTERLAGVANRHRSAVDALPESLRAVEAQIVDALGALGRVDHAQARLGVLALNTGLEGAKLEGAAGRAVVMVAEELRALTGRASTATKELSHALGEIRQQAKLVETRAVEAKQGSSTIVEEAGRALVAFHAADEAVAALGEELTRATGLEPEVARALQSAELHARELLAALTIVTLRAPIALTALRPLLEPLFTLAERVRKPQGEDVG